MNSFETLLQQKGGFRIQTRILPPKSVQHNGPRDGKHLGNAARAAGDRWYFNAIPIAKFVYSKIEERYSLLPNEAKYLKRKNALMAEAKSILNENRNQIFEAVLPMFDVIDRKPGRNLLEDGEALPEADQHVYDYFIQNVMFDMVRTYRAWLPEFVAEDQVDACDATIERLGQAYSERLGSELRNFQFGFKIIVAPGRQE